MSEIQKSLLIDIKETGQLLSCSRSAVYGLIRSGKLRPLKIGRATRLSRSEVEAFATSGR